MAYSYSLFALQIALDGNDPDRFLSTVYTTKLNPLQSVKKNLTPQS